MQVFCLASRARERVESQIGRNVSRCQAVRLHIKIKESSEGNRKFFIESLPKHVRGGEDPEEEKPKLF